jgi:hypothetical protein
MSMVATDTEIDARDIARESAQCAARLVQPDGMFIYAYDADTGERQKAYELIRHCGTCWAIAHAAVSLGGMDEELDAAGRAMAWILDKHTVRMGRAHCIVQGDRIHLGTNALAILALVELANVEAHREERLRAATEYGEFVLACRRKDGEFHHKLDLLTAQVGEWRSDIHTAEALFALARLSQATSQSRYLDAAADSIAILRGQDFGIAQGNHWMAYAISALHESTGDDAAVDYAGKIVRNFIDNPAYRYHNAPTPISCATEALVAYGDMLVRSQGRTTGPRWGEVMRNIRENLALLTNYRLDDGAFIISATDRHVQIDVIQHAVSAYLGYDRLSAHQID